MQPLSAALAAVLALASAAALADGGITVADPWGRATPPTVATGAIYMTLVDDSGEGDRLLAASSLLAAAVVLHASSLDGDVMRMGAVEEPLEIPAGGRVVLAPGGLHLMLTGLAQPLGVGMTVPVRLTFERAGEVEVAVPVGPITAMGPPGQ
jgi:copper(I)-binding protein